jgi:hypothetical protein
VEPDGTYVQRQVLYDEKNGLAVLLPFLRSKPKYRDLISKGGRVFARSRSFRAT